MKLLIIGPASYKWSLVKSYYQAFSKIDNIEIFLFDPGREGLFKPVYRGGFLNRIKRRVYHYLDTYFVNRKFLSLVNSKRYKDFDLILDFKSYWLDPGILSMLKKSTNALIFHFNPDSPFDKSNFHTKLKNCMPFYDCYFIWNKGLISKLYETGAKKVEYLPFAWDSELHCSVNVNREDFQKYGSDIAFIGNWTPKREKWLETISDMDLAIWGGYHWEKLRRASPVFGKWRRKIVVGDEFVKICKCSKIIPNFLRDQNRDSHNQRTFEVPGCGGFLLTERSKEQLDFFKEEEEIACFSTSQELKEKIEYYLPKDDLRKQMVLRAYKKVKEHTYLKRAKRILEVYRDLQ